MIYNLITDNDSYREFGFDIPQLQKIFGSGVVRNRIDMYCLPFNFKNIIKEPLELSFIPLKKADAELPIPDLSVRSGRMFLSKQAYSVLFPIIKDCGDFLPVNYALGSGYFFIPLLVAKVDNHVTQMNEWEEITSLGFIEEDVKEYPIFRTDYDTYYRLFCQEPIKKAIEDNNLTGLYITNDLANVFPEDRSSVEKAN